ncbi:nickel transport system ATP-binding protein/dipeptide transport system ATP-binding protein [Fontibacillus phaseoli]|uniref:Nickel transport system ATP-binding protein/dipeptide transport system ATP-binding protein n=2 Tax=Fontibacillus phaseoli TaxID=1416533 RepID=A0A369B4G7_9BACL|nr:nickel transport system ATP-binding protein/dipeptide transport system ATP-binding protein [Fontibacillus phaseoli]
MLQVQRLCKEINGRPILSDINFVIEDGGSLAIVGESGSGKSTLAQLIMALKQPTSGQVLFNERSLPRKGIKSYKEWYSDIQIVFQNTASTLNPAMSLYRCLEEPLINFTNLKRRERRDKILEYLNKVGLHRDLLKHRPGKLSGGQYQRACLAKALIISPKLLICDEIVASLDIVLQQQMIELLMSIQKERGLSLLFITHDLSLVPGLCADILVMKDGKKVEQFNTSALHNEEERDIYTITLLKSTESLETTWKQYATHDNKSTG